jgi:acetyl esterase/lipase
VAGADRRGPRALIDPRVKRFLEVLAATSPLNALDLPIAQRRAGLADLMRLAGPPADVARIEPRTLAVDGREVPARLYIPLNADGAPAAGLVYVHGGGLVGGSLDTHEPIARALAAAGCCRVLSIGYRLAPEHPYPAGLDDTVAAIRHCRDAAGTFGIDPTRLGVCGDSAGGMLVAAACQALTRSRESGLKLAVLLCPILDYGGTSPSRREFARGYLVEEATLQDDLRHCLSGGLAATDERLSPLRAADLSGLPPLIIHTAEYDPLRDEARAYYERVLDAGGAATYTCHAGMIHFFYGLGGLIPQGRTALATIGAEIRAGLAA